MTNLVTLAQAQVWIGDTDPNSSGVLSILVSSASQMAIDFLGWDPTDQAYTGYYSGRGTPLLLVREKPVTSVTSAQALPALTRGFMKIGPYNAYEPTVAPITLDVTNMSFFDRRIFFTNGQVFPAGKQNIQVAYTAGYPPASMPPAITQAVLMTVKSLWMAQNVDPNVASQSFNGVMSQQFWQSGPGAIPPAARSMLTPYKLMWTGEGM
jgi:hypothetical protein